MTAHAVAEGVDGVGLVVVDHLVAAEALLGTRRLVWDRVGGIPIWCT